MVYTKRDFLKYIGTFSILSIFGVNTFVKSQNSNVSMMLWRMTPIEIIGKNFKIISEFSQRKICFVFFYKF